MSKIKAALTRKFGPLPAWAWALIGGGALLWYRSHTATAAASTADQPDTGVYGPWGQDPYPITGGGDTGGGSDGGAGTTTTTPTNGGPPTINVEMPGPGKSRHKRQQKHKPQHDKSGKGHKDDKDKSRNKKRPRSPAHTHNGRQHANSGGAAKTGTGHHQARPARPARHK